MPYYNNEVAMMKETTDVTPGSTDDEALLWLFRPRKSLPIKSALAEFLDRSVLAFFSGNRLNIGLKKLSPLPFFCALTKPLAAGGETVTDHHFPRDLRSVASLFSFFKRIAKS